MDPERARELLAAERARLTRALHETDLRADEGELSHVDQHPADGGSELYLDERDQGIGEVLREELAALERAERRLEGGIYGRSIESGEPIPDARLEAMPTAERTVEEQARYERSPGPRRTQDVGPRPGPPS